MIKDSKLETYMKKINRNAEKVIDVLQSMDLDFDEGQEVLKKALIHLERSYLKNKIRSLDLTKKKQHQPIYGKCSKCGADIMGKADNYCWKCGRKLETKDFFYIIDC